MQTPKHVAFIMDGNRRWAHKNKLALFFGHEKGARNLEPLVEFAIDNHITHLTFWAFSTENWQRPEEEVSDLMKVFRKALNDPMIKRLADLQTKISIIGDIEPFPQDIQEDVQRIVEDTQNNSRISVTIALNYGGRKEIMHAIQSLIQTHEETITEETVSNALYTKNLPDPDFIIRTGGEKRLSGYLPWQSVYAELYFTDVLWPDFSPKEFAKALEDFENRSRRFGR